MPTFKNNTQCTIEFETENHEGGGGSFSIAPGKACSIDTGQAKLIMRATYLGQTVRFSRGGQSQLFIVDNIWPESNDEYNVEADGIYGYYPKGKTSQAFSQFKGQDSSRDAKLKNK